MINKKINGFTDCKVPMKLLLICNFPMLGGGLAQPGHHVPILSAVLIESDSHNGFRPFQIPCLSHKGYCTNDLFLSHPIIPEVTSCDNIHQYL
jgi:hypothetical protein